MRYQKIRTKSVSKGVLEFLSFLKFHRVIDNFNTYESN